MENQTPNDKLARVYRDMQDKMGNDSDILHDAFLRMLEKSEKYQALDIESIRKLAYTIMDFEKLYAVQRRKRNTIVIESEIKPLSDDVIGYLDNIPDNRPNRKEKPSVKFAKIAAQIIRRIKSKKIRQFFILRFVKGLKLQEVSAKMGYKPDNWTSIGRIQQDFQDVIKKLPQELIDDLKYYRAIAISYSIPTRFIQGETHFPKEKQRFTWEMLKKEAGECKQLSDFVDDYKEKLDTDDNELIMQAILVDNPMPDDRMPLQIPYRLRITARKQTI